MAADTAKATIRARAAEMPIDAAATSLPRRAARVRPIVPSRSCITTIDTTTSATTASTRKARSLAKSIGPISGRGTWVPVSRAVLPPPTQENFTITASKKKANARVAMASHTPPNRRTGSDSSAPTTAASAAPISAAARTDMLNRSAIWKTVKPPMAANVPWHSDIWPPMPVMTVTDR